MAQDQTPNWQPISALPRIASLIDGMLHETEKQYHTLQQAKGRPHVLDDALVARVIRVYTAQLEDLWLFEEQLARWARGHLTATQKQEVERLSTQLNKLREVLQAILALADELKLGTIEQVLKKSDVEVALDFLRGQFKR